MRFSWLWLAVPACGAAGVAFLACDNNGTVALPYQDGGATEDVVHFDGPTPFDAGPLPDAPKDVAVEAGPPPPSRLLFTYNGSASSEVVAFGLASKAVDGRSPSMIRWPGRLRAAPRRGCSSRATASSRGSTRSIPGSSTRRGTCR